MSKLHLRSRCEIYTEGAMGTQRKNDAIYSHPWRDYFPIERSNQTVVQLLKRRGDHLSAIRIWRGAAKTGLEIPQLYRAHWSGLDSPPAINHAIAFHTSSTTSKTKPKHPPTSALSHLPGFKGSSQQSTTRCCAGGEVGTAPPRHPAPHTQRAPFHPGSIYARFNHSKHKALHSAWVWAPKLVSHLSSSQLRKRGTVWSSLPPLPDKE